MDISTQIDAVAQLVLDIFAAEAAVTPDLANYFYVKRDVPLDKMHADNSLYAFDVKHITHEFRQLLGTKHFISQMQVLFKFNEHVPKETYNALASAMLRYCCGRNQSVSLAGQDVPLVPRAIKIDTLTDSQSHVIVYLEVRFDNV